MDQTLQNFILNDQCVSPQHPWSVVQLSVANAQLAGVLAGFMLLALTTLLAITRGSSASVDENRVGFSSEAIDAVVYLGLGVIVLGLDAYFFGSAAAIKPPSSYSEITQQACERAWLVFMPAAGLLGLGAVLLVAGLVWIIVPHGRDTAASTDASAADEPRASIEGAKNYRDVARHASLAALLVMIGPLALLAYDSINFIDEMYYEFDDVCDCVRDLGLVVVWACVIGCAVTVGWILMRNRSGHTYTSLDIKKARERASVLAIGYLLLALLFIVFSPWGLSGTDVHAHAIFFFSAGISLCIVIPSVVFVFIARAMPSAPPADKSPHRADN